MAEKNTTGGGIGFAGATFLVLLVLKLTRVIDWSWWWVTVPIWGPFSLAVIGFVIYAVYIIWTSKKRKSKFQQRLRELQREQQRIMELQQEQNNGASRQ